MSKNKVLIIASIISLLFLTGCMEYKCIDGRVYQSLEKGIWIESGLWQNKCVSEVTK
jgi:hypothetical protein